MSKVAIQGNASGTGTFTIAAPNSNTDRTLTLPDEAGTVLTSASDITQNSGPAFLAYPSTSQAVSAGVWTKVTLNLEAFDTNSCFASSRFTPTVAGYYQLNGVVAFSATAGSGAQAASAFYKNGGLYSQGSNISVAGVNAVPISDLVYFNGSTDYVELYVYLNGTALTVQGSSDAVNSHFSGALVRAV